MENDLSAKRKLLMGSVQIFSIISSYFHKPELRKILFLVKNKTLLKNFRKAVIFENSKKLKSYEVKYLHRLNEDKNYRDLKEKLESEAKKILKLQQVIIGLKNNQRFQVIFSIDKINKISEYDFRTNAKEFLKNDMYDNDKQGLNFYMRKTILHNYLYDSIITLELSDILSKLFNFAFLDHSKHPYYIPILEGLSSDTKNKDIVENFRHCSIGQNKFNYLIENVNKVNVSFEEFLQISLLLDLNYLDFTNIKMQNNDLPFIFTFLRQNSSLQVLNLTSSLNLIVEEKKVVSENVFEEEEKTCQIKKLKEKVLNLDVIDCSLKILILAQNHLSLFCIKSLKTLICYNKIYFLDVSYCQLKTPELKLIFSYINRNSSIKALNLSGNSLNKDGFVLLCLFLLENISLEFINLSNMQIGDHCLIKLSDSIKVNQTLRTIVLNNNDFSRFEDRSCHYLLFTSSLEHLYLNRCTLPAKGIPSLINAISRRNFKSIHLANCTIPADDLDKIMEKALIGEGVEMIDISGQVMLFKNLKESLMLKLTFLQTKSLIFKDNKLNGAFLREFSESLSSDKLVYLDISNNTIGDVDFSNILIVIEKIKTLQTLLLNSNYLSNSCVDKLLGLYLKISEGNLKHLGLSSNKLDNNGILKLIRNLNSLRGIETVEIEGNNLLWYEFIKVYKVEKLDLRRRVQLVAFSKGLDQKTRRILNSVSENLRFY